MRLDFTAQTGPDHQTPEPVSIAGQPTTSPEDVLEIYSAIEACSSGMLEAARQDDWTAVAQLKSRCDRLIESVRAAGSTEHWPREWRNARLRTLARVLHNEGQLRRLAFPQARQLDALLAGTV